jgi:hypothetical protein
VLESRREGIRGRAEARLGRNGIDVKRTAFKRRTPLTRAPFKRREKPMRQRARKPRDRGERADTLYLAWLLTRPCRVPRCPCASQYHHLRHDERGAALGGHIKDDRRAISLCNLHHIHRLHGAPHLLRRELGVDDLREWQDRELAIQRAEYKMQAAA